MTRDGWRLADVNPRTTVTVVGDGAVGLSAVLAAKRLRAERILLMSRNPDRARLGREFGATDIWPTARHSRSLSSPDHRAEV